MKPYLLAESRNKILRNEGMEIMASGPIEALERYFNLGGQPGGDSESGFFWSVWMVEPDGLPTEVEVQWETGNETSIQWMGADHGDFVKFNCMAGL